MGVTAGHLSSYSASLAWGEAGSVRPLRCEGGVFRYRHKQSLHVYVCSSACGIAGVLVSMIWVATILRDGGIFATYICNCNCCGPGTPGVIAHGFILVGRTICGHHRFCGANRRACCIVWCSIAAPSSDAPRQRRWFVKVNKLIYWPGCF